MRRRARRWTTPRRWRGRSPSGRPSPRGCIIEAVDDGLEAPIDKALEIETRAFLKTLRTEDASEGIQAFFAKREPAVQGQVAWTSGSADRVALVTGGARSLGKADALVLAAEGCASRSST